MTVAMRGDDGVAGVARESGARKVTRTRIELIVTHSLDDDLVEPECGDDEASDGCALPDDSGALAEVNQARVANGTLRVSALPGGTRVASGESSARVGRAGMDEQGRAGKTEQRADSAAHRG